MIRSDVWMSCECLDLMQAEANDKFPLETGGVVTGYRSGAHQVITQVLGPGPGATHTAGGFFPDHDWQCAELDSIFAASQGATVYLGDWHTHPGGRPKMSGIDRQTLLRIARHQEARAPQPLMIIGAGNDVKGWDWRAHVCYRTAFGLRRITAAKIFTYRS